MIELVPFCPEQMGGLSTPRPASNIIGGEGIDVIMGRAKVVNTEGRDVTDFFLKGAYMALNLAKRLNVPFVILKDKSPSCGLQTPYCESLSGYGIGVTAALFKLYGIDVIELGKNQVLCFHKLFHKKKANNHHKSD